ncbi:MAG: glycosyltransferase family 4 protein [Gemmatimonas sp.]|nr:glycosyltransferase family 4 protein [Gemmatimonas sp.]
MPYPANTGFAWNYIEGLYAGVSDLLSQEGVSTFVAYPTIKSPPIPLEGSSATPVLLDASLGTIRSIVSTMAAIRRLKIDTLYFTDFGMWHWALPLLRLSGATWIVAHDHTSGHRDIPTGVRRALKWIKARIPGMTADRILTVSEFVARRQRDVSMAPPSRVFTVLNGLSLPKTDGEFHEQLLPSAYDGRPIVTCVCRAAPEKGVDVLFRAFDSLHKDWPDAHPRPVLVYVGDGPALPQLEVLRKSLSSAGDIHLTGYRSDVHAFLRMATVCVVPSLWEDACPLGVLEPMAWGKPVVASAVGGVPEEINSPDVGVLVPKGDERALAGALHDLLIDPARRDQIGRAARSRIANDLSRTQHLATIASHVRRVAPHET